MNAYGMNNLNMGAIVKQIHIINRNTNAYRIEPRILSSQSKSVSMGDVNIHAHNTNASDISHHVKGHMQKALNSLVTNTDNGVIQ